MLHYRTIVCAISVLTFAYCNAAAAEPSTIGAMSELTGPFARFGEDCRRGYELAQSSSSADIRIVYGDNQNDPKVGISEFRRMVDTEHASMIVTSRSPVALALNPLSVQQKLPLIGVVSHPRLIPDNPYALRAFPSSKDEGQTLAAYVKKIGETRIATISIEDEFFVGLKNEFESHFEKAQIVFSETIAPTESDFASLLLRIKSKAPSAIFVNLGPGQLTPFINKVNEAGITAHLYSNFLIGSADIRKALGERANGIVFAELDFDKPEFQKASRAKFGSASLTPLGYSCYVGLQLAFEIHRIAAERGISLLNAEPLVKEIPTLDGAVPVVTREAKFTVLPKKITAGEVTKVQ